MVRTVIQIYLENQSVWQYQLGPRHETATKQYLPVTLKLPFKNCPIVLLFLLNKPVHYYFNSITVFQFFPLWVFWSLGPSPWGWGEEGNPKTPKTPSVRTSWAVLKIILALDASPHYRKIRGFMDINMFLVGCRFYLKTG